MSKSGDKGNTSAAPKAPESQDTGKCDKISGKADLGVKDGKPNAEGKAAQAKDKKFCLPFGKSWKTKPAENEKSNDATPKKKYTLKDRIKDIKDGFAEISKNRKEKKAQKCKAVGAGATSSPGGPGEGRRMVYPYTFSAKLAQFPFRYHFNNVWLFKYFIFGIAASLPVFIYLGQKSYSPENVAEWKQKREKLFGLRHH